MSNQQNINNKEWVIRHDQKDLKEESTPIQPKQNNNSSSSESKQQKKKDN